MIGYDTFMKTNRTLLINQVKAIILELANPQRIYLYGSQASGEAKEGSDIDIAYEDAEFMNNHLIEDRVKDLKTLVKIDVSNIAKSEERFKNRVMSTGKVLYSATKQLRAEDALYNFTNALDRFENIILRKSNFEDQGFEDVYLDLIVKRFEFTFEMSWKALKRYLEFLGLEVKSPRGTFKEAYAQQIITAEDVWLDMIEQRNLSSHIYDESEIEEILDKTQIYLEAFKALKSYLEEELKI